MKEIDLDGKHFMTFGKKNCGKSYFNNWLMSKTSSPYVCFDPMREHPDYTDDDVVIRPENTRGEGANEELEEVVAWAKNNREHFGFLWVDEVNRFHQKGGQLQGPVGELMDLSAHWGMAFGGIARRPSQVHTDMRDLADYLFLFKLNGISDVRTCDDIARGLGERVASLKPREFMVVHPDGSYEKHAPIKDRLRHEKGI